MYASSVRILTKYSMNAFPKHRMAIHYLYIPLHVRWMLLRLRLRCKLLFELPGRRLWRRGVRVVRVRLMVKRMARLRVERAEKLPKSPKEFPQSNHPTSVRFWNPRAGPARISRSKVAANVQKQRMWHCQLSPRQRQGPKKNQKNDDKPAESTRHSQKRMELGDGRWMYEVLEGQTFGCANCRCIYNGCKICKRPGFRGNSAAFFRQYQQQQCSTNDPETNRREAEEPQVKKPKRKAKNDGKEGGKSRKSKKD